MAIFAAPTISTVSNNSTTERKRSRKCSLFVHSPFFSAAIRGRSSTRPRGFHATQDLNRFELSDRGGAQVSDDRRLLPRRGDKKTLWAQGSCTEFSRLA